MNINNLLSIEEIHDNMEYLSMRYAVLEKVHKALEPDMAMLTLSDSNEYSDEYNKYKSFIEYRYNNIEALHTIVNDVFKYFQMIAYHKYANYFTLEPEHTLHNSDIDFSMYNWDDSRIEVLTATVIVSEINYDTVKRLVSFDFGKFMDNYFSDISGFIKKYDMLIGDEGKKCVISKGDVRFRLNRSTKTDVYRLLSSSSNSNFQPKNKRVLTDIYQYLPESIEVI